MDNNHFLKYPFVNETGSGCKAIVKKIGLYVQCNKKCVNQTEYCNICKFSFNKIHVSERVVGGFKTKKPRRFDKMLCYKKTLKKHGLTITKIKKQAAKLNLTLNMKFINEVSNEICNNRVTDVSVVMDTSDEEQPVIKTRGRPKKVNKKTNEDLINNMVLNENTINSEDESDHNYNTEQEYECQYNTDEEIEVVKFNYTGYQKEYHSKNLFIDDDNNVYDAEGNMQGIYSQDYNVINEYI